MTGIFGGVCFFVIFVFLIHFFREDILKSPVFSEDTFLSVGRNLGT